MSHVIEYTRRMLRTRRAARRMLTVATLAVAAMLPAVAAAAPPSAAIKTKCPDNYFCVFDLPKYQGDFVKYQIGTASMALQPPKFDNRTSSYWNRTDATWCVYSQSNWKGLLARVHPDHYAEGFPWWLDNQISSVRPATRC